MSFSTGCSRSLFGKRFRSRSSRSEFFQAPGLVKSDGPDTTDGPVATEAVRKGEQVGGTGLEPVTSAV